MSVSGDPSAPVQVFDADIQQDLKGPVKKGPALTPKDAATLMVIDRGNDGVVRVLMGRRHMRHAFMPGKFVFPGGRVDSGDARVPVADAFAEVELARLMSGPRAPRTTGRARALAVAAIRETYEEAGLLIGTPGSARLPEGEAWTAFSERGLLPALSRLVFLARAITPPGRPRRFDTRFFAVWADAIADRLPEGTGPSGELEAVQWIAIDEAATFDLPGVTRRVLRDLGTRLGTDPGLTRTDIQVPFYQSRGELFFQRML